ncbi:MAG: glycosyltransferase family 4 protein [Clostridium baratii]|uniref:glycosyltransferase family 4 protein n=1 Tax=Clostridium baratii TaxID=1561 RepID=UPI00242F7723|nr:glycosyltransferase family 4 protein [Clostridium baratii]MBS6007243.1 glycosyltransferase family 4 protein [Clostridium baratii]
MNILFVSNGPVNINNWSGSVFHLYNSVINERDIVDKCELKDKKLFKIPTKLYNLVSKNQNVFCRSKIAMKDYAKQITKILNKKNYDLIVSIGSIPVSMLKTNIPIIIITDGTFNAIKDYYPEYGKYSKRALKNSEKFENMALKKANTLIFASEWARDSAVNDYKISPNKTIVCPFGANFESNLSLEDINKIIDNKINKKTKLLFVGIDWVRKGGDKTLEILRYLKHKENDVELHIVGCKPNIPKDLNDCVILHGFLNKRNQNELKKIKKLYEECNFFVLPTLAECFGIVFCEASSYGIPSITHATGGTTTSVKNNINGFGFKLDSTASEIGDTIISLINDKEKYRKMCISSYLYYKEALNWRAAKDTIQEAIYKTYEFNNEG